MGGTMNVPRVPTWQQCDAPPALAANEVHVWRVDVRQWAPMLARLTALLDPDEQARADRFVAPAPRQQFTVARAALRQLLAGYLACPLGDLRFELGPLGKPRLLARNSTDLRFNVSHSGELVQLAFSRRREVGVDVEHLHKLHARDAVAVGLPVGLDAFFMISSMIIAVPTGIKIFNWVATLWRGNLIFETPMLFALGFLALFTMGGLSGIFLAAFPVDWQVTDTYYVVAHLHYVLFGGSMFAIFGGVYYWWPKMFGRRLDEQLGKLHFWLLFVGFNLTFLPQHMLGLLGMPRRVWTYHHGGLWEWYNLTSSIGSGIMLLAMLVFVGNVVRTARVGRRVGNDPWLADTLEWYTTSPPPPHNFDSVPYVTSARPLRDVRRRVAEVEA